MSESVVTSDGAEMSALELRLSAVEKLQRQNLPKFNGLLRRMTKVEKAVNLQTVAIAEIKTANASAETVRAAMSQKLDEIYVLISGAKSVGGFVRKHGPRVIAFVVGIAVARGYVTSEIATNFLHLFGL